MKSTYWFISATLLASLVRAQTGPAERGKILQFGWDTPAPVYVRDHISEMEKVPFDGLVLTLWANGHHDPTKKADRIASYVSRGWVGKSIDRSDFSESIDALKATKFVRFTDNFLRFNAVPGDLDYFDPHYSSVVDNFRLLAQVARETGMKGIMLDSESYDGRVFNYARQPQMKEHNFAEYQQQARLRGREMMAAASEAFPEIRIMVTLAYAMPHGLEGNEPMESHKYGLLPSLLDGMLEGAGPNVILYDGWEYSYSYRTGKEYDDALNTIHEKSLQWSAAPDAMRRHWRAGFGIWVDYGHKWDPQNFSKNFYTPSEFAWSVHQALRHTDRYVWIWSELPNWWHGAMPPAYIEALRDARRDDLAAPPSRPNPF